MHLAFFMIIVFLYFPADASWWTAGTQVTDPEMVCSKAKNLRGRMKKICRGKLKLLDNIKSGMGTALQECQFQFKNSRWNCTTEKRNLKKILLRDTRETGFLHAIAAAGITDNITRSCAMGHLVQCSCDKTISKEENYRHRERMGVGLQKENKGWVWGGCSDNVHFGYQISRTFLDYPHRNASDIKTLVRLHNNEAGRLVVKKYRFKDCKCHGLSGSCTLQTCWKKLPPFREVGNRLRERYLRAARVIPSNDGRNFIPDDENVTFTGRKDLVFVDQSVDFCKHNRKSGSLGTQGRECDANSKGDGSCDLLCCGRGFNSRLLSETIDCKCRFQWCCQVTCEKCVQKRTVFTCQ